MLGSASICYREASRPPGEVGHYASYFTGKETDSERGSFFVCFVLFWLCYAACRILVPRPGIEPVSPAVEAQSLNHWTTREVPRGRNLSKATQLVSGRVRK